MLECWQRCECITAAECCWGVLGPCMPNQQQPAACGARCRRMRHRRSCRRMRQRRSCRAMLLCSSCQSAAACLLAFLKGGAAYKLPPAPIAQHAAARQSSSGRGPHLGDVGLAGVQHVQHELLAAQQPVGHELRRRRAAAAAAAAMVSTRQAKQQAGPGPERAAAARRRCAQRGLGGRRGALPRRPAPSSRRRVARRVAAPASASPGRHHARMAPGALAAAAERQEQLGGRTCRPAALQGPGRAGPALAAVPTFLVRMVAILAGCLMTPGTPATKEGAAGPRAGFNASRRTWRWGAWRPRCSCAQLLIYFSIGATIHACRSRPGANGRRQWQPRSASASTLLRSLATPFVTQMATVGCEGDRPSGCQAPAAAAAAARSMLPLFQCTADSRAHCNKPEGPLAVRSQQAAVPGSTHAPARRSPPASAVSDSGGCMTSLQG